MARNDWLSRKQLLDVASQVFWGKRFAHSVACHFLAVMNYAVSQINPAMWSVECTATHNALTERDYILTYRGFPAAPVDIRLGRCKINEFDRCVGGRPLPWEGRRTGNPVRFRDGPAAVTERFRSYRKMYC